MGTLSFERDVFHTFGVPSHTFDFSLSPKVREKVEALPFIRFYPEGLAGEEVIQLEIPLMCRLKRLWRWWIRLRGHSSNATVRVILDPAEEYCTHNTDVSLWICAHIHVTLDPVLDPA